ncbi:DoxX family protein [Paenibacillaceae bacterium]|nr:DoxX family protein [Paenibacillaceae bacterium]
MNIALWVVQGVLGIGFVYSGWLKAFQYKTALSTWSWVNDVPQGMVTLIGIIELIGVLGLILPMALKIKPILTPIAAVGLAAVSLFGGIFHLIRNESDILINLIFMVLALFIAFGRFKLKNGKHTSN